MDFMLTDEQKMLRESLLKLTTNDYSFEQRAAIIASDEGYSRKVWGRLSQLGVLGLPFDGDLGGADGTSVDMFVVMEALGRALIVEPFLSTVVLAGGLLRRGASADQKTRLIPPIIAGEALYAVALLEPQSRYNFADVACEAMESDGGYQLNGAKAVVYGGPYADQIIVSARIGGERRDRDGVTLFIVPANAAGLSRRDYPTVDGARASELLFENVVVGTDAVLGTPGSAISLIDPTMDELFAAVCAEAVGAMGALNAQTVQHCRTRIAFGQPLSKFQVIQHRLVDMRVAYEHAAAMALGVARSLTAETLPDRAAASSAAAMVQVFKEADFVAAAALQLHGAMGMTDELAIGHYFRRLVVIGSIFGDVSHHLCRFMARSEYSAPSE